ncbi:CvpA family protein [Weissella kandleri]|uniref:CvpA family protein n=1 Tax=Weissella kandleri TaxID=1616 RepID=UPI00387E60EC
MIISILILLALLMAWMHGYHEGFVRVLIRSVGRVLVWVLAVLLAHNVGDVIANLVNNQLTSTWSSPVSASLLNQSNRFLYSGIGFSLVTMIGFAILRQIQRSMRILNKVPVLGFFNRVLGALLNTIIMYTGIFFLLYILGAFDWTWMHEQITYSPVAQFVMQETPILSSQIYQWFIVNF